MVQPPVLPVTEYVVVDEGVAVTLVPVVPLNPVPGVHVYDVAPEAVNVALLPVHTIVLGVTATVGD